MILVGFFLILSAKYSLNLNFQIPLTHLGFFFTPTVLSLKFISQGTDIVSIVKKKQSQFVNDGLGY